MCNPLADPLPWYWTIFYPDDGVDMVQKYTNNNKKLRRGDNAYMTAKNMLGWLFNTICLTIPLLQFSLENAMAFLSLYLMGNLRSAATCL